MASLGEELPKEMARVRDVVMPAYLEIGQAGALALLMMRRDLDFATKALAEGNVLDVIRAYKALKEYKL